MWQLMIRGVALKRVQMEVVSVTLLGLLRAAVQEANTELTVAL